jgi:hypothetical protein
MTLPSLLLFSGARAAQYAGGVRRFGAQMALNSTFRATVEASHQAADCTRKKFVAGRPRGARVLVVRAAAWRKASTDELRG